MSKAKFRLDLLLVKRGLAKDLTLAQARIMSGDVIVNDHRADKPGEKFVSDVEIRLKNKSHPYVSRGALKLKHALSLWPTDITGAICLDIGSSTGGFTQVLLEHGASLVYAVDVGYGLLAESLRIDPRVKNLERTHILQVKPEDLISKPKVITIDVSFISLTKILSHVLKLISHGGVIYILVKPQFEASPEQIAPGGLVIDEQVRLMLLNKIIKHARELGSQVLGYAESPIRGTHGNVEYLLGLSCTIS